ncbi:MAG TPA: hypothetical protein DD405_07165 [Desulfobacteraceae bacterium]|nr:hypothetical protein [Desulfobacteraceae bacterium]
MKDDKVILEDSLEAATYRTDICGWVSKKGEYWGEKENLARMDGATHIKCDCGNIIEKRTYCERCDQKQRDEQFYLMPEKAWNGEDLLFSRAEERYYHEWEGINSDGEDVPFESMKFVFCGEVEWPQIHEDYFWDDMPDDNKNDELSRLVDDFNYDLRKIRTNCFLPVGIRAVLVEVKCKE